MKSIITPILLAIVAGISLIACKTANSIESTRIPLISTPDYRTVIPVSINGKTYNFLWDTGVSKSSISQTAMRELELDTTDAFAYVRVLSEKCLHKLTYTESVDFKLGSFEFRTLLLLSESSILNSMFNIHGIIGSNIINMYSWLFDFENQEVVISNKGQRVELKDQDKSYDFDLFFPDTTIKTAPYLNIKINDTVSELMHFDTGFGTGPVTVMGAALIRDIIFLVSDSTTAEQIPLYIGNKYSEKYSVTMSANGPDGVFIENITLNGYDPIMLYSVFLFDKFYGYYYDKVEYGGGWKGGIVIGADFLKRFSRMYYDAKASRVSLIISASDTTVYGKREIDKFWDVMAKFNK